VARTVRRADVNQAAEAAVRAVSARPHGVYCVDLKTDGRGRPLVTEINIGRFFTTSNFFAHAGLNMPAMYVRLAMGEPVETVAAGVPQYDGLPEDWYWVRMIDMGYKLVKDGEWRARTV
jgi:carbamoyl-phosphate synthase large subunit